MAYISERLDSIIDAVRQIERLLAARYPLETTPDTQEVRQLDHEAWDYVSWLEQQAQENAKGT